FCFLRSPMHLRASAFAFGIVTNPSVPGYLSLMISVHDLTKLYTNLTAVSHLSFDIAGGEVLGLVGPNGAGKTTTLRCLCGIMAPSAGRIVVAGHDIQTDAVEAKRALAFIPDEPHLFDYLTVEEHLRFVARLYGVRDAEAQISPLLGE